MSNRIGRKRATTWLMSLLVLALLAAACGSGTTDDSGETDPDPAAEATDAAGGTESPGGVTGAADPSTLVVGSVEVPGNIDPARVYEKFASDILFNTTNRLVEFAPGSDEVGPGLAESWEVSEDGLTYTFTLREGVTFHDGSEFDSEDVKFSLDRSLGINHPDGAGFLIAGITSVETPDPQTVVVTIAEPNATFLSRLNYTVATILPSDSNVYPTPDAPLKEPAAEAANEFLNNEEIVGTGPYQLTEYTPGESMTLEVFPEYWGDAPDIDTVKIQFFEEAAQMKNALDAGEIDLNINEFGPAERASLGENDDIEIIESEGGRIRYIVLDVTQEPFTDPEVRRAIATAVDRQRIIDEVFEGKGVPLFSMIPKAFEVNEDFISDIEAAVPDGTAFDLWYPLNKYGDTEADVAESISRSLTEAGFDVTTQAADWAAEYSNNLNNGTYAAYLLGWYPDYVDPDDYIEPFYSAEGFIGFYQSDQMDELIAQEQQQEVGSAERAETFSEIQELAAQDMPYIPLYEEGTTAYVGPGVSGVEKTLDASQQTRYFVMSKS